MRNLTEGLGKDSKLHRFCVGCSAPFLSLFFRKEEPKKKDEDCGCGR